MAIHEYEVYNLGDFLHCVSSINNTQSLTQPNILWFRGHRKADYILRPTLYRNHPANEVDNPYASDVGQASTISVHEELRKQHFIAKNYHFLQKDMNSDLEWFELMQHHGVNTRIMDWSESAMHSLLFALECFIDGKSYRETDRITSSPCMWVFDPIEWNRIAILKILENESLIKKCAMSIQTNFVNKEKIEARMKTLKNNFTEYMQMKGTDNLKFLFNLSSILNDFSKISSSELIYRLSEGEYFYCLFYLLKYVYMDKGVYDVEKILPLAIIESYHSERIKAQRGVFTIFPYYEETDHLKQWKKRGINLDSMENMDAGSHCLHKILLCNPQKIVYELLCIGADDTWLYPEMPIAANIIELRKVLGG